MTMISDSFSNQFRCEIRKWGEVKKGFTHFAENDVGFAKITPCFENRKSVVFRNIKNGYGSGTTELYILRPFCNSLLSKYLLFILKSDIFIEGGKQTFSGAVGQQRINKEYVNQFLIPLPPLQEQIQIVEKTSQLIDALSNIEGAVANKR